MCVIPSFESEALRATLANQYVCKGMTRLVGVIKLILMTKNQENGIASSVSIGGIEEFFGIKDS